MRSLLLGVVALLSVGSAHANEQTVFLDQALSAAGQALGPVGKSLAPDEIYRRTQKVLDSFAVPAEPDYQFEIDQLAYTTSPKDVDSILKSLDPSGQFRRFYDFELGQFRSFRDRDAKKLGEYRFGGNAATAGAVGQPLALQGMRVALDPGHMGGDAWDERTGKYVRTGKGVKISEGLINLQTALLVEQKLKALGAEVLVTHRGLGPVSSLPYEQLDLREFGRRELRTRSLEDWFQNQLASSSESSLEGDFKKSSAVKNLFSERARSDYYAQREDLIARARMIADFKPDFTLVIHFDSDSIAPTPKMPNITRAYVPGAFMKTEFATSEARAHFLAHLGQGEQWKRSVQLSRFIVDQISADLGVKKPLSDVTGSAMVLPGVFARNLALTRQIAGAPISYLEALCYGNDAEFARLLKTDGGTLLIDGKAVPYSRRLENLAQAITTGIQNYVKASAVDPE